MIEVKSFVGDDKLQKISVMESNLKSFLQEF